MKKQILGHVLFWAVLMALDISSYLPVWHKKIAYGATINYAWILAMFYISYFVGVSFCKSEREYHKLVNYRQFWIIIALPIVYISGTMVTDKYVLDVFSPITTWTYCIGRLIMIYPFIGSAVFLAGYQTLHLELKSLRRQRNELIVENNYLLEDNDEFMKRNHAFKRERESLLSEINLLKFELIASRERVSAELRAEFAAKFDEYEEIIRRLRNGDDYDFR